MSSSATGKILPPPSVVVVPKGAFNGCTRTQRAVLLLLQEEGKVKIVPDEDGEGRPVTA